MRSFPIPLIAAAALAACGAPPETGGNEVGNALTRPPADLEAPEANAAPADAAPAEVLARGKVRIPAAFRGVFDQTREACARPSEYRLVVSGGEIIFHESIGKVRGVAIEGPDQISVTGDYQGEGESWSNVRRLKLAGDTLTISGEGTEIVRVRCP